MPTHDDSQHVADLSSTKPIPTCVHVRHKMMYVDQNQMTPGRVDDSSSTRVFWCNKTMDPLGPDDRPVTPRLCHANRTCYCHFEAP
ncbi:MAG: hypothetical protein HND57_00770 [Planctomycetes bacterium]|nr:hypothetical protein [Planctomycetota bacterium]